MGEWLELTAFESCAAAQQAAPFLGKWRHGVETEVQEQDGRRGQHGSSRPRLATRLRPSWSALCWRCPVATSHASSGRQGQAFAAGTDTPG